MRPLAILALALVMPAPAAARVRTAACCLEVFIPGVSDEPRCLVVNLRARRLSPRRLCRLAGGQPRRRGSCTCPGFPRAGGST